MSAMTGTEPSRMSDNLGTLNTEVSMRMRIPVAITALALTLTACGGSSSGSGSTGAESPSASASASASSTAVTAAFGAAADLGGGVKVTVSAPANFKPGSFASNYMPGQVPDVFDITVDNKGAAALDMTSVLVSATSGAATCTDVLDGDNGINGAPTDPLATGATSTFKFAIACDAKVGDPLAVTVTVGTNSVTLNGKLA